MGCQSGTGHAPCGAPWAPPGLQGTTSQSIDGDLCLSCFPGLYCLGSLHKYNTRLLGNVVRVYPWIVQGLTFLSA